MVAVHPQSSLFVALNLNDIVSLDTAEIRVLDCSWRRDWRSAIEPPQIAIDVFLSGTLRTVVDNLGRRLGQDMPSSRPPLNLVEYTLHEEDVSCGLVSTSRREVETERSRKSSGRAGTETARAGEQVEEERAMK